MESVNLPNGNTSFKFCLPDGHQSSEEKPGIVTTSETRRFSEDQKGRARNMFA
jgi:hypothetical protein